MVIKGSSHYFPVELEQVLKKERILVVDDEEIIINVISRFFPGQRLEVFKEPMEALAQYREMAQGKDPYTLVITDIYMPRMDGLTLLKKIKEIDEAEKNKSLVVVMSGFGDIEKVRNAKDLGAAGFIDKPFLKKAFMETLYNILMEREG